MLKVSNKGKKNEQMESIQVLDRCTKIMKEDRLMLRQMIKDENIKLIELIAKHKRKSDLNDLQTELRKFIKDKRGPVEEPQQIVLRKVKSKERTDFGSSARSPSRSNLDFRKKQRDESVKRVSDRKPPEIESAQKSHRVEQSKAFTEEMTPLKLEFQTVVSQAPIDQDLKSECKSECILQYNAEEIQQYMQQEKHYVSKQQFCIPQLISLSYKYTANPQYQNLFTDWNTIFQYQDPQYNIKQPHYQPPEFQFQDAQYTKQYSPPEYQSPVQQFDQFDQLETKMSVVDTSFKNLEIRGVTAEDLFQYLVHSRFSKRLNLYQLKENARVAIPDAQIDYETLFQLTDKDEDGWISLEELGNSLLICCVQKEETPNKIKLFYNKHNGIITKDTFISEIANKTAAEILYHEIDLFNKGNVTYWELFNHFEELGKLL